MSFRSVGSARDDISSSDDAGDMVEGTILEANFAEEGRWHAAKVVDIDDEGLVDVQYLSGEVEKCILPDNIRAVTGARLFHRD